MNYNNQSGTAAISIGKADAVVTVTGYSGTFDAAAHGATGSAAGVVGDPSAAGSTLSLGASFTNAPGGTASWSFAGGANYNNQSGSAAIAIGKADAVVTVAGYSGTFDAATHGATGSAAGVVGDPSAAGSTLSLGASFTNAPGGTANWSFTGGTNYNDQNGTAAIAIGKADAVVTVTGYSGTFDAAAHGATGSAAGSGGRSVGGGEHAVAGRELHQRARWNGELVVRRRHELQQPERQRRDRDRQGRRGGDGHRLQRHVRCGGTWRDGLGGGCRGRSVRGGEHAVAGRELHRRARRHGELVVHGWDELQRPERQRRDRDRQGRRGRDSHRLQRHVRCGGTWRDGLGRGSGGRSVGGGEHAVAGRELHQRARWNGELVVRRRHELQQPEWQRRDQHRQGRRGGDSHWLQRHVRCGGTWRDRLGRGCGGDPSAAGSTLSLGASFTNAPGGTANWSFTGGTNYNNQSGTAAIAIGKANATVTVSGFTGPFDGVAHGATGTFVGVPGDPTAAGGALNLGASFTLVPGGTANWSFTGGTNYNNQTGSVAIIIGVATTTSTVTASPSSQQYTDKATLTATLSPASLAGVPAATDVTFYVGTQFVGGPVALNAAGVGVLVNVALLEPLPFGTSPTGQMSPGVHTVKAVFGGKNPNFAITDPTSTLTITSEDARATYTGASFASTSGSNSSTAKVTLSATIQDITATAEAAGDASFGDIRNARVSFINRDNNTVIASNLPVGLVSAGDTKTGTVTYDWTVDIGARELRQFHHRNQGHELLQP
jgi:hypothetical protein